MTPSTPRKSASKAVRATSTREGEARAKASADAARAARAAVTLPPIAFPEELPVSARREEIAAAIRDHQVVIVAGETGSGKTTQLPKIALELGRGITGHIGHTQPRRIAARSVAERIASELGTSLGEVVGYQVRFTDESSTATRVKVMTDGILLAQIQRDPDLRAYDTLIIDEAHERSLNIDVLLGYLTRLLPRRPDLKVIITSATIDTERFASHFGRDGVPAPVIEVTGRTYPVEVRYRPLEGEKRGDEKDLMTGIVDACEELMKEGPGDILVFLSGEREIRDAADALAGSLGPRATDARHPQAVELLPLYARLSAAEQHRVFATHSRRRIVLATNVAETSLTVPGIHYVVDPGTARISRYNKTTKVQRLPIEPVSQASARQRSGRAGRLADGIAIRLYSQADFEGRPEFTEPEILRTSLASVLLHMISVGAVASPDDVATFPFVEPPDTRAIRDGLTLLADLGAVRSRHGRTELTGVGRQLARLPIDPRQARMIVEGAKHGVAYEATVIAAALSIQDPRERPGEKREEADAAHRRFATPTSDLLAYLNLWAYLRTQQKQLSGTAFRRLCKSEYLHYLRVREWQDLVTQLRQSAREAGIAIHPRKPQALEAAEGSASIHHVWDEDSIHRSVLAGLLTQIGVQETTSPKASEFTHLSGEARQAALRKARKRASNEYLGTRGARFAIQPSSPLAKKPPAFVMAAELVETNRLWARDVARIDPAWAEELAGDLAKRQYSDPRWSARQGAAVANEKVTLYGVPIVAERQVLWGKINPADARELFIRHALVQGEWTTHHAFWKANQRLIAEAEALETRTRSYGLAASEEELFDFYDERLPDSIVSTAHFDRWWKDARRDHPDLLTLTADVAMPEAAQLDLAAFPETWTQGDLTLPLSYQFEPGSDADGVTVHIPLAVLPRVSEAGFDWLVPGMLDELCTATIRALPKPVRRLLVPAPDVARSIATWLRAQVAPWAEVTALGTAGPSFRDSFTRGAAAVRQVDIPADAWEAVERDLPSHLRMTFRAIETVNGRERLIEESSSLAALQRNLAPLAQAEVKRLVERSAAKATGAAGASAPPKPGQAAPRHALVERERLTTWPEGLPNGTLSPMIETQVGGGVVVRAYPAIVAEAGTPTQSAALRILADATQASARHAQGIRRLLLADVGLATKRVTTRWNGKEALLLASAPYRNTESLVDDVQLAAVTALTLPGAPAGDAGAVRDASTYAAMREAVRASLEDEVYAVVGRIVPILQAKRDLDAAIKSSTSMALLPVLAELKTWSSRLVGEGFVSQTPPERLRHLPRYLRAATYRLERAPGAMARDTELAWTMRELDEALAKAASLHGDVQATGSLAEARWLLEELRVSLFAQQLGTDGTVSVKRAKTAIAALGA